MQVGLFAPRMLAVGTVVAGALIGLASGCSPDLTPSKPPANSVVVRVINAAPAAGDLSISDSTLNGPLKGLGSANYLAYDSTHTNEGGTWYVFKRGSSRIGVAGSAEFLATYSYDLFISDSGATPVYATQELPTVEPDTISTNTKLRVVNVLPTPTFPFSGTTGYDVYVTAPGASLASLSAAVAGLTFGLNTSINSGPTYMDETPGATEIRLEPNTDTVAADVVLDTTITLAAGQGLTLFATQQPGGVAAGQFLIVRDH